jgi:hypothetical protein
MERAINGGENTGLNDDAEILREYELMLLAHDGDKEAKREWYKIADDRAVMDINKGSVLNAWEDETE